MAPASPSASDVASDSGKAKRKSLSKAKVEEEEVVADSEAQSDADGGSGDEEEYEIETILDAKKGQFEKNKLGYFVKWKGYDEEHNSWVMEEDANAPELIAAYWAADREKKNKSPKKSAEPASKRARKSVGGEDNGSDAGGSASAASKKRGRKSSVKAADKEEDADERPAKKPRKATEKKTLASAAATTEDSHDNDVEIGNMSQHMQAPTWEHLVKIIDTVERVGQQLVVYFTLNSGEHVKEDSGVCHEKFPEKLLQFYEKNLRWKESSD